MATRDTKGTTLRLTMAMAALVSAGVLSIAGCTSSVVPTTVPTAQSVAGVPASGGVTLTEKTVGGVTVGKGVLSYQGKKYPFELVGSVIGPGGLSSIDATGEVFKLNDIAEFAGAYAQGAGEAGLQTASTADLWLENKAGVVMHLSGTQAGATLSLGRDEIFIKMVR